MHFVDLIFAALPILLLIFLMTKKSPMPSARALPLAAVVAYGIRLMWVLAWFSDEFPSVAGGMIGLILAVWLARQGVGLTSDYEPTEDSIAAPKVNAVIRAFFYQSRLGHATAGNFWNCNSMDASGALCSIFDPVHPDFDSFVMGFECTYWNCQACLESNLSLHDQSSTLFARSACACWTADGGRRSVLCDDCGTRTGCCHRQLMAVFLCISRSDRFFLRRFMHHFQPNLGALSRLHCYKTRFESDDYPGTAIRWRRDGKHGFHPQHRRRLLGTRSGESRGRNSKADGGADAPLWCNRRSNVTAFDVSLILVESTSRYWLSSGFQIAGPSQYNRRFKLLSNKD